MPEVVVTPQSAAPPAATPPPAPPAAAPPAAAPPATGTPPLATGTPPPAATPSPEDPFKEISDKFAQFDKPKEVTKGKQEPPKSGTPPPATATTPDPLKGKRPADLLREEKDHWKNEHSKAVASAAALENKIKEFEAKGRDTEALTARLTQIEKERDTALGELRAARQEVAPEFVAKYKEPFDKRTKYATRLIEQLTVVDPETGVARKGTFEDLHALYLKPIGEANAEARKLFGADAGMVIDEVNNLRHLNDNYNEALAEEKKNVVERTKAEKGQQLAQQEALATNLRKVNQELAESVEEYHDKPDDKEASELRLKGYKIFDDQPATMEQRILKHGHIRQIVAAHFPLKLQLSRVKAKLAEAEAKLASYENNDGDPGKTGRPGGTPPASDDNLSWDDGARKALT